MGPGRIHAMSASPFRLYPHAERWWSFSDYRTVLEVVRRLRPVRVLEFGPGSSTLALIEGGAQHIDCCEDNPVWFKTYRERLERRFPAVVALIAYQWSDPLTVPELDPERYDLALIDGPLETPRRPAVVEYCLRRCAWVLVPTESNEGSRLMREACARLGLEHFRVVEFMETGPAAGGFALLNPPC